MSLLRTLMALVVMTFISGVILQAIRDLKSLFNVNAKTIVQTILLLGVFVLLALTVVQCQTGNSPTPTDANKAAEAAAKKAAAKKAAAGTPNEFQPNTNGTEDKKTDSVKTNLAARLENARLDAVDSNYASISLTDCVPGQPDPTKIVCKGKTFQPKVNDAGLRAKVKQFHVGDHLRVDINDKGELQELRGAWSVPNEEICTEYRLLVLAACALALFGLASAVTVGKPFQFIVGMDNRYSNSKFQVALWFWVLMSTYLATVVFRVWFAGWDFFGAVSIPTHLLELSGLSAITYGGAKAITTAKVDAAKNPVTVPGAVVQRVAVSDPKPAQIAGHESLFKDLVQNDQGGFDFGDFQMLVVTFIAVGMYLMLIFHFLGSVEFLKTASLPDVDTTILASFGLGQGAYLAKKAGGDVGKS